MARKRNDGRAWSPTERVSVHVYLTREEHEALIGYCYRERLSASAACARFINKGLNGVRMRGSERLEGAQGRAMRDPEMRLAALPGPVRRKAG